MYPEDLTTKDWNKVAESLPAKDSSKCNKRWLFIQQQKGNKIKWTKPEDKILSALILANGAQKWAVLARNLYDQVLIVANKDPQQTDFYVQRNGKQCRERWLNALDPQINKGSWST